jgi:hypothetical protein
MFGEEYKLWSSSLSSFLQSHVTSSLFGPNILLSTLFSNHVFLYVGIINRYETNDKSGKCLNALLFLSLQASRLQMLRKQYRWLLLQGSGYTRFSHGEKFTSPQPPTSMTGSGNSSETVELVSAIPPDGDNITEKGEWHGTAPRRRMASYSRRSMHSRT